ncbi:MAG: hypothetical protein KF799_15975 [Bdellovibrionales bacterium]|nr:hypothetical protein [Bdellovibrionales bacterium]
MWRKFILFTIALSFLNAPLLQADDLEDEGGASAIEDHATDPDYPPPAAPETSGIEPAPVGSEEYNSNADMGEAVDDALTADGQYPNATPEPDVPTESTPIPGYDDEPAAPKKAAKKSVAKKAPPKKSSKTAAKNSKKKPAAKTAKKTTAAKKTAAKKGSKAAATKNKKGRDTASVKKGAKAPAKKPAKKSAKKSS